jgi:hypothetical protein
LGVLPFSYFRFRCSSFSSAIASSLFCSSPLLQSKSVDKNCIANRLENSDQFAVLSPCFLNAKLKQKLEDTFAC